ncbi:hypothetical protein CIRMBP1230_01062 [Enterococcus cecorum]|uniref:hypothetical protein n=1 Tax=Enterococcus cecorum TaxID=44008 RepID=UPI0022D1C40F|nr:hypothetical protein [Enterococcus cecorum]CAI3297381.1 hypothetical protein CIRMBP1281_00641 [Enterococcus cecorum]CAI3298720.1 hypothetical protein CIRMBP1228_00634 [Enterococcus cecorum]CAI3310717.1 hypothetical protein CIRMBP1252_00792 [Enterococcus cecorum]CAI3320799.1 hypothetical protein CIRMBP1224_00873 [Enterococcus cecorum]CAI3330169.1 hypothetical protein CIRMBP1208_00779 [Enterococcus cecorum]
MKFEIKPETITILSLLITALLAILSNFIHLKKYQNELKEQTTNTKIIIPIFSIIQPVLYDYIFSKSKLMIIQNKIMKIHNLIHQGNNLYYTPEDLSFNIQRLMKHFAKLKIRKSKIMVLYSYIRINMIYQGFSFYFLSNYNYYKGSFLFINYRITSKLRILIYTLARNICALIVSSVCFILILDFLIILVIYTAQFTQHFIDTFLQNHIFNKK